MTDRRYLARGSKDRAVAAQIDALGDARPAKRAKVERRGTGEWACALCTLINRARRVQCATCGARRDESEP